MADVKPVCILHVGVAPAEERIHILSAEKFEQLKVTAQNRRKFKSSKYRRVLDNFPTILNDGHGYHYSCYKKFTSVSAAQKIDTTKEEKLFRTEQSTSENADRVLRSAHATVPMSKGRHVLDQVCIFCNKKVIKVNYVKQPLIKCSTNSFEKSIREECRILKDYNVLRSIGEADFTAVEVSYHGICRSRFSKQASVKMNKIGSQFGQDEEEAKRKEEWCKRRDAHKAAFAALSSYIEEEVLEKEQIVLLSSIYETYMNLLESFGIDDAKVSGFYDYHLLEKVQSKYGSSITVDKKQKETIIYKCGMNVSEAAWAQFKSKNEQSNPDLLVKNAALLLRKTILSMKEKQLDELSLVKNMLSDADDFPYLLQHFLQTLFSGPTFKFSQTKLTTRMKAIASDIVFGVSNGKTVPAKHLALALGYDEGRDGYLDLNELKRMMEKLGAPQTHLGLKAMIKEVDEDGDNKISFREFMLIFRKAKAGELMEESGLSQLAKLTEIDVDQVGVCGAKNFFEAKIEELRRGSKFEDEIRQEQEERKRAEEEKAVRRSAFKEKAAIFQGSVA